jgi:hypothetical protein
LRWDLILRVAAIAALVEVAAGIVMYIGGVYFAPWSGPVSLLVLGGSIAMAQRWYAARTAPERMGYAVALAVGAAVAAITGITYVAYNLVSISFVYPHFIQEMVDARFAQLRSPGMNQEQANQLLSRLRSEITLRTIAVGNLRFLTVMGTLLAAVLAIFTRRPGSRRDL